MSPPGAQGSAPPLLEQGCAILAIRTARAAKGQLCPAATVAYTVSTAVTLSAAVIVSAAVTVAAAAVAIALSTAAD